MERFFQPAARQHSPSFFCHEIRPHFIAGIAVGLRGGMVASGGAAPKCNGGSSADYGTGRRFGFGEISARCGQGGVAIGSPAGHCYPASDEFEGDPGDAGAGWLD